MGTQRDSSLNGLIWEALELIIVFFVFKFAFILLWKTCELFIRAIGSFLAFMAEILPVIFAKFVDLCEWIGRHVVSFIERKTGRTLVRS